MDQDFLLGNCQQFNQSPCQNRGMGIKQTVQLKSLYFYLTSSASGLLTDMANLIAFAQANTAAAMYELTWGMTQFYVYNYGTYPTFSFGNGSVGASVSGGATPIGGSPSLQNLFISPNESSSGGPANLTAFGVYRYFTDNSVIAACVVTWVYYPDATVQLNAQLGRFYGGSGQIYSSTILTQFFNSGFASYPGPPYPPKFSFYENLASIACPTDVNGSHSGQVFQMPIPTLSGFGTLEIDGTGYPVFGEVLTLS